MRNSEHKRKNTNSLNEEGNSQRDYLDDDCEHQDVNEEDWILEKNTDSEQKLPLNRKKSMLEAYNDNSYCNSPMTIKSIKERSQDIGF